MSQSHATPTARALAGGRPACLVQTLGYYGAFVALGLSSASLGPTLPGLAEHTRSHLSEISILFPARSLGYLLGSFQGARLYDRMPGHSLMAAVLLVMGVGLAVAPVVPWLWLLAMVLLMVGLAEGAVDAGGNTLLVWVHGVRVAPFMNGLHFFFGTGALLSPLVVAQAIQRTGDVSVGYWALALATLPAAAWLLRLPSPALRRPAEDGAGGGLSYLLVGLLALFFALHVGAEGSFGGWVFTYARALGLGREATAAYLTSVFWGSLTLGRLLAIPIAARFSFGAMLLADLAGCLASVGLILLSPHSSAALWLGTIGMGLSIASAFPTSISLAERRLGITGRVTSWLLVGASAGGMAVPWLIGQFFELIGARVTMFAILADLLAAVVVLCAILRYSPRRAPQVSGTGHRARPEGGS